MDFELQLFTATIVQNELSSSAENSFKQTLVAASSNMIMLISHSSPVSFSLLHYWHMLFQTNLVKLQWMYCLPSTHELAVGMLVLRTGLFCV